MTAKKTFKILVLCALALSLLLIPVLSFAAPISLKGLNETRLYELYSEVQAQIQLNNLRKKVSYQQLTNYEDFARNPNKHKNEKICFEGTVLQVIEGSTENTYRISVDKRGDQVFLLTYAVPEGAERILEDDRVLVYAKFVDLYTYKSTLNQSITVPYCEAALIVHPVANNNVKTATPEELEAAVADIRDRLSQIEPKDHDYTKLSKKNYDYYARNKELHENKKITFTGKVLQTLDGGSYTVARVAVDSDYDRVVYLTVPSDLVTIRILEDDVVIVKGVYTGLYTYSSTMGGEITIPACTADNLSVKGYKAPKKIAKDREGNYKLTKQVFEDYSRRPNEHLDEPIAFSATVLQVIEGQSSSEYRMSVDNDYNSVIYVILPNDHRSMRILEDDKVNVVATFNGLLTYTSTIGSPVTIPQCTASSVVVPGKKATIVSKDASGFYKVNADNYESFARDEDTYKSQPISFTATVVQVVEDSESNTYRLAVDGNNNCIFLAGIDNKDLDIRILEDDTVEIEATSAGLYTYSSTMGGMITVPSCLITKYTVQNYRKIDLGSPDQNNNYRITKANFQEIARNPEPYQSKGMTFRGKVVQVVEGSGGDNIYRVAVDSDNSCIFYIEYTLPADASHILENDTVKVTGTYYGIYTYTTTMGSTMSVPAVIATEISR